MPKRPRKSSDQIMTSRVKFALAVFILMMIYIVFKLGQIMIIKGPEYQNKAKQQQHRETLILPTRGTIYDSSGKELAISIPKYDLWIALKDVEDRKKVYSQIVSTIKVEDKALLKKRLKEKKEYTILINTISLDDVKKLKEKKIANIWFDEKFVRYYPYGNFASYVLGHTSYNNVGLSGIEASMDLQLKGIPGKRIYVKDAHEREISLKDIKYDKEIDGKDVMLTIDEVIQHNLEKALRNGYQTFSPKSVTGIIMDTKTGDILGMSTIPDYNPNLPREPAYDYYAQLMKEAPDEEEKMKVIYNMWRNPSVNNILEPGSPFKLITAAAAIEEAKTYTEEYFTDTGSIEVAGEKLKNWTPKPFGTISFKKAVEQSVNTIMVQVGQRVGKEVMVDYAHSFGFGKKTNIGLPGEEPGVVRSLDKIGPVELANMSYGQGISVTPIQLITAINSIANGGELVEPHIVKKLLDKEGNVLYNTPTKNIKKVVSSQTANTILSYMESVVNNGSGKKAKVEGYRIAGKTGSANKVIPGQAGYAANKFICSFVGIAPVEDPQITVLVVIDEPVEGTQSGSESAAPIAGEILESTLKYLGVNQNVKIDEENSQKIIEIPELKNKSYTEATEELKALGLNPIFEEGLVVELKSHVVSSFPSAGERVEAGSAIMLYMKSDVNQTASMPNLIGKTKEQAKVVLDSLELKYNFSGSGKVVNQVPKAGIPVEKDFRVSIELK